MNDYRVNLDIFAGPLDLLLYLVRKDEVDIYDISIARITEQYIRYIEMLKDLDIDLAGDFLVMAHEKKHPEISLETFGLTASGEFEPLKGDPEDITDSPAEDMTLGKLLFKVEGRPLVRFFVVVCIRTGN